MKLDTKVYVMKMILIVYHQKCPTLSEPLVAFMNNYFLNLGVVKKIL